METTLKLIAVYKDNNHAKIIFKQQSAFFEVILKCEKDYDKVCVNAKCLSENRNITFQEFKSLLILGSETLKELFESQNKTLLIEVAKLSKDNNINEFINSLDAQKLGYANTSIAVYDETNLLNKSKMSLITEKYIEESEDEIFLKSYEDEYLRNHRFYKKQRKNALPWDEYFMAIAKLSSLRSKDPSTQVGACIVGEDNRILSIGYNGAPIGMEDNFFPWERNGENLHTKYMYVCHAEMNAILNYRGSRKDFEGSTVYVDLFPCNECAKLIIQAGIKKIVYLSDKYANTEATIASKRMFDATGVEYKPLNEEYQETITLSLNPKDK